MAARASTGPALGRLTPRPGASPGDDDGGVARGATAGRKRGHGGERDTRKRAREEDSVEFENGRMPGVWMANKRTQVEMTRLATMRAEEKRQGSRRSGKRPNLEGAWEGRGH